ncbi:hypothetical protein CCP3SC1AL1_540017 [Gammaproteobacteria bacterium]
MIAKWRVLLGILTVFGLLSEAFGEVQPLPDEPRLVLVSAEGPLPLHEILNLGTDHLFSLGIGIVAGATIIAPQLEIGELSGIVIGVIAGDLLYRLMFPKKRLWFSSNWF